MQEFVFFKPYNLGPNDNMLQIMNKVQKTTIQ